MTDVTIPVLDAPIDPNEVAEVIEKQVKPNKSAGGGPVGLSPGLFKLLPVEWIVTLTMLLNSVFVSGCYPAAWAYARLNMLFKKGISLCCDNYRGISIINSIYKIYDYILCNRLMKWYSPDHEQAGAQPGGRFKNTYELLNLRALKISKLHKNHIFQCMGKIFCVEFQRVPLKFHTKYLTHTSKDVDFIHIWKFKSSLI